MDDVEEDVVGGVERTEAPVQIAVEDAVALGMAAGGDVERGGDIEARR